MSQDPKAAQPGKGAAGDQWAVQTAQSTDVNPSDERIPTNASTEMHVRQLHAFEEQEEGTGLKTTDGYTVGESGELNNFAVEPQMYYEEDGKRVNID